MKILGTLVQNWLLSFKCLRHVRYFRMVCVFLAASTDDHALFTGMSDEGHCL